MKDVVNITGINQPMLHQWFREGYVSCRVCGNGSGTKNVLSFRDICALVLLRRLIKFGLKREVAAKVVEKYTEGRRITHTITAGDMVISVIDSNDTEQDIKKRIAALDKHA